MAARLTVDEEGRRRLWYDQRDIEALAERTLAEAGLLPVLPACEVDVEALIEMHLGAIVDYGASLDPPVLGFTMFSTPVRVSVSRQLTEAATRRDARLSDLGRWRATIAHEAAHILLHARLYDLGDEGRAPRSFARCGASAIDGAGLVRDWREVQANMGMAALLMPGSLFDAVAGETLTSQTRDPVPPIDRKDPAAQYLVRAISAAFKVSFQASSIRCTTRGFITES